MRVKIVPPSALFLALLLPAKGDVREALEPFLDQHCYACHDDFDQEADLNLLDLKFDPKDPENRAIWEKVFHRVEDGEMPPKKKKRPAAPDLEQFLKTLGSPLYQADRAELERTGRVHARRLTQEEYQYTMEDLLGIDIPLNDYLTAESGEGFDNKAETQQISHFHLDGYLRAAGAALDEAFSRALRGDEKFSKDYSPKLLTQRRGRGNPRGPELRGGKAISWRANIQFYGRMNPTIVPEDGWYRVTVKDVEAINPGPDGVVWGELQSGFGHSSEPLLFDAGLIEATESPTQKTFLTWIREGHILLLRPKESGEKIARISRGGNVNYTGLNLEKKGFAGIRFSGMKIERVYPNATRAEVRQRLFHDLAPEDIRTGGKTPKLTLQRLLNRFANIAFRRPVKPEELEAYHALALKKLAETKSFPAALKVGYHALLTSPRFLTFIEKPGELDDFALASRLSYFLWKSMPDYRLRKLAREGVLSDPAILGAETNRLLGNSKSHRFIQSFTNQWLDLREINATQPDPRRFRDFDQILQISFIEETRRFIDEMVRKDLSVTHFLQSDFAFLNTRLQRHYKMPLLPVRPGGGLQKVSLKPGHRSGLLTQGSILKITADGSVTSPILRGVWINERILGRHIPPPPPNIPAVEPDIRGAVSIRDQLAKHSTQTSCKSCHAKIDPSGFALENYDPIGNFRSHYGKKKTSTLVDPSGMTPDGSKFDNFKGWRDVYLKRPEILARAFASQVLEYSTGGDIRFSDRTVVDRVVEHAGADDRDYGLKSIIHACIASPVFQHK
ncbi:MAG: DUF1592 domain-containing protein [Akkermansiaceae bacterium]